MTGPYGRINQCRRPFSSSSELFLAVTSSRDKDRETADGNVVTRA